MGSKVNDYGSASDVANVNPYTQQFYGGLGPMIEQAMSAFYNPVPTAQYSPAGTAPTGPSAFTPTGTGIGAPGGFQATPGANLGTAAGVLGQMGQAMPQINQITQGLMGGAAGGLQSQAMLQAQENMRGAAGQYAQVGAGQSGAAMSAISRGAALPFAQAGVTLAEMESNLGKSVLDQFAAAEAQRTGFLGAFEQQRQGIEGAQALQHQQILGQLEQQRQGVEGSLQLQQGTLGMQEAGLMTQMAMQQQQLQAQQQMQAGQMGLGMLGMQGGMAQPQWWQPTYIEQQNPWMQALGGVMGMGGAALGGWLGGLG